MQGEKQDPALVQILQDIMRVGFSCFEMRTVYSYNDVKSPFFGLEGNMKWKIIRDAQSRLFLSEGLYYSL